MTVRTVPASLVMTVLDEERSLPGFLDRLAAQTVLPEEVVVVDGGSRDRTVAILDGWQPPPGVSLHVAVAEGANISEGRNQAIGMARHPVLLVTDGGTTLHERWTERLWQAIEAGADVASGFFEPRGETPFESALGRIVTPVVAEIDPDHFLPSSRSVAFRRSWWQRVGGYPEWLDYCEDLVLDLALKDAGARFTFVPGAVATWNARPDLPSFARQYYRYARGDGKAALWGRRHAVRYGAYVVGLALLASGTRTGAVVASVGAAGYLGKSFLRVWRGRATVDGHLGATLALVPVVVVTGDLAKMAGYPAGLVWRYRWRR